MANLNLSWPFSWVCLYGKGINGLADVYPSSWRILKRILSTVERIVKMAKKKI